MIKYFVKKRLMNIAYNSAFIWLGILACWNFGWLAAPLVECLFWYVLGAVVGLAGFVSYDYYKYTNKEISSCGD